MIQFQDINIQTFLNEFWQKKPCVIRNALPGFINPISPDELAGLALEENIESRLVHEKPHWHLKRGPFKEADFVNLPKTHWTLLVQGVDRIAPEVYELLNHFDFIPQWRVDDVMISFAPLNGSVGPHYDNYDVFLYQGKGRRKWSLTTQNCQPDNYIENLELRIMKEFSIEDEFILEEGDMLYLPAHVGHYGISLSEECMTYSFGYRSYQGQELWDSLGDYASEHQLFNKLYQDPNWTHLKNTSEITKPAWLNAQKLLKELVDNEKLMQSWFGAFATQLDKGSEVHLPIPLEGDELLDLPTFMQILKKSEVAERDASCRFAYIEGDVISLYINGCLWDSQGVSEALIRIIANHRIIQVKDIMQYVDNAQTETFLHGLWQLQWLQIM